MNGFKLSILALAGWTICGLLILPGGAALRAQGAVSECCCDACVNLDRTLVTGPPGTDPWTIVSAPGGFKTPALAQVETPSVAGWGSIPGASWVGPGLSETAEGDYTFQRHFNLCRGFSNPTLVVRLLADNSATVFLNGCKLGVTKGGIKGFVNPPTVLPSPPPSCFQAGCNTLKVVVHNDSGPTGLDLSATLTALKGLCE
jgi:hypothetical protein